MKGGLGADLELHPTKKAAIKGRSRLIALTNFDLITHKPPQP